MGDYDPVTGTLTTFSRDAEPGRVPSMPSGDFDFVGGKLSGHFDYPEGRLVLLFRLSGVLYLQVEGQRMPMSDHTIERRSVDGQRVLRVVSDSGVVLELTYDPPIFDPPLSEDPTAYDGSEEDFEFGLFLANLSTDQSRQARIYTGA